MHRHWRGLWVMLGLISTGGLTAAARAAGYPFRTALELGAGITLGLWGLMAFLTRSGKKPRD